MKKTIATLLIVLFILNIYIPTAFADESDDDSSSAGSLTMTQEGFEAGALNGTGFLGVSDGNAISQNELPLDDARGENETSGNAVGETTSPDEGEGETTTPDDGEGETTSPNEGDGETTDSNDNGGKTKKKRKLSNDSSAIITAILEVFTIVPKIGSWIMTKVVLGDDAGDDEIFTIKDMLFGEYYLFDINFFSKEDDGDVNAKVVNDIKDNVSIWYTAMRNIAIVGSVLIIVYVGLKLAIAVSRGQTAERARYNKMMMSWLIGFILIFVVQYIVIILFYASSLITEFVNKVIPADSSEASMEQSIITDSWNNIASQRGINKLIYVILYWATVYYQIKFFLMYARRSLETFFLMILAPLVCMLYPIDFLGDGRSQSYQVWLKTLIGYILLQPIHLCIYAVFMFTASELAKEVPLIAIAFYGALSNGEKIVKSLFGLQGPSIKGTKLTRLRAH